MMASKSAKMERYPEEKERFSSMKGYADAMVSNFSR